MMSVFSPIKCFLQAVALSHASKDASVSCSMQDGPVLQAETINNDVVSPISRLLFWRCPAAIFRTVIFGVFDSFKACAKRSFAHIGKKGGEVTPSFAAGDSTTSVIFPSASIFVQASATHGFPASIGGCSRGAMSVTACWYRIVSSHSSLLFRFLVRAACGPLTRFAVRFYFTA